MAVSSQASNRPSASRERVGWCALVFDAQNLVGTSHAAGAGRLDVSLRGSEAGSARIEAEIASVAGGGVNVVTLGTIGTDDGREEVSVFACSLRGDEAKPAGWEWHSVFELRRLIAADGARVTPLLAAALEAIAPQLIRIPYLNLGENEYLYRFRTEDQRNRAIYSSDERGRALYQ
ncbi:MAG: hypothetical protein ACREIA_24920, partial [Opitutaceae bacterium]